MITLPTADPHRLRAAIERLAGSGASLRQIDRVLLHPAPVDEERRSALWLYALHRTERERPGPAPRPTVGLG